MYMLVKVLSFIYSSTYMVFVTSAISLYSIYLYIQHGGKGNCKIHHALQDKGIFSTIITFMYPPVHSLLWCYN